MEFEGSLDCLRMCLKIGTGKSPEFGSQHPPKSWVRLFVPSRSWVVGVLWGVETGGLLGLGGLQPDSWFSEEAGG